MDTAQESFFIKGGKMKKLLILLGVIFLMLNFVACSPADDGGGKEEPETPGSEVTIPDQIVTFSFWDWQIGTAGDAANLAKQIKELGFTGADITFRWNSLEYTRGSYSFRYIDAVLDEFAAEGLFLSTSLMFWSIGLPWEDEIEWQKLPNGNVYEFSGRGAAPSFSDEATVEAMSDAYTAFTSHVYEKYKDSLYRMHARSSQYGELEYYCDAGGVLDYGEPAIAAFRSYLKEQHPTPEELTYASSGQKEFTSLDELDAMTGVALSEMFYFDWQMFRQAECLKMSAMFRDIQHETAPGVPFALQVGCIWDEAATTRRGIVDPYLASQACDIIHTDDGPGFPHDFSMDYIDVNPGTLLASEIDGLWHPTIQALVTKGDKSLSPYVTQAEHMGMKGIAYLNTANWSGAEIQEYSDALSKYPTSFFGAAAREEADKSIVILINTADIIYQKQATTALYQSVFNRLSNSGAKQVRFVTDTQLLAQPELLEEIETICIGNTFGTYYLRGALGKLLADKGITLCAEQEPSAFTVKDEYGSDLASGSLPAFAKA